LKILYTASTIKGYLKKSQNSQDLSACKYYVFNSNRLYKYISELKSSCSCINTRNNLEIFLQKAENSKSLLYCEELVTQSVKKLDSLVNDIIDCKKVRD
jgi:hypothetical protein